jgi:WD40 repeat protein
MIRKVVIKGHSEEVTEVCFLMDNGVLSSSRDSTVVHWDLAKAEKVRAFEGHTRAVLSMLVSADEKTLVTGSEDLTVNIWTLDGILIYTLALQHPAKSLYMTANHKYLVTIDPWQISFWQLDNLSLAFSQNLTCPQCVVFANDDRTIAIAQGNTIFIEENPLTTPNLRVVGKNKASAHKFMSYVQEIFNDTIRNEYLDTYNQWIFTPYIISISHILAYKNKYDILHKALIETQNRVPFAYTIKNESPLSISVFLGYKCCIETCLKYLKKEFWNKNPRAYVPLGKCLTQLNALDVNSIPKVYEMIFLKDQSWHLPSYCNYGTRLPYVYYSDDHMIDVRKMIINEHISTHGQSIILNKSLCP